MTRSTLLVAMVAAFLAPSAAAQNLQPASLTITPSTTPEVLQVLDNTGTWATVGTVNPASHVFTPAVTGFTGTKTAGSCTFFIANGLITNVTGC